MPIDGYESRGPSYKSVWFGSQAGCIWRERVGELRAPKFDWTEGKDLKMVSNAKPLISEEKCIIMYVHMCAYICISIRTTTLCRVASFSCGVVVWGSLDSIVL